MAGRASPRWRRLTVLGPSPVYPRSGCTDLSVVVSLSIHTVASPEADCTGAGSWQYSVPNSAVVQGEQLQVLGW